MNLMPVDLPLRTYASLPDDGQPEQVAVFFHGYGSDGRDLFGISGYLRHFFPKAALYFPDAPQELGFFGGYQWFNLDGFDSVMLADRVAGERYLKSLMPLAKQVRPVTEAYLNAVMKHSDVSANKTVIGGFSQGGMMALYTALRFPERLAACVGLSAVACLFDGEVFDADKIVSRPPVTLIHGDADNVVPPVVFERNVENLKSAGVTVSAFTVPEMMHEINDTALRYLVTAMHNAFN